ncbi:MAG: hypothetical protein IKS11_10510, partial [Lachnospiraceae bacterium]|nr:hypothetical protein [Lachnospiraceae bacterium]
MNDKKKYYMRGLGFGILITASVLAIKANITKNKGMSDAEICARAEELGYVLKSDVNLVPTTYIDMDELKNKLTPGAQTTGTPDMTGTPEKTGTPAATPSKAPTGTFTPTPAATLTSGADVTPEPTPAATDTP